MWWDGITSLREEQEEPEVDTWSEMKQLLRDRFVPKNYIRTLYDKLQQLKQGSKSVDAYYKEMELILQRARVREAPDQTMQRFLAGLQFKRRRPRSLSLCLFSLSIASIFREHCKISIHIFALPHLSPKIV